MPSCYASAVDTMSHHQRPVIIPLLQSSFHDMSRCLHTFLALMLTPSSSELTAAPKRASSVDDGFACIYWAVVTTEEHCHSCCRRSKGDPMDACDADPCRDRLLGTAGRAQRRHHGISNQPGLDDGPFPRVWSLVEWCCNCTLPRAPFTPSASSDFAWHCFGLARSTGSCPHNPASSAPCLGLQEAFEVLTTGHTKCTVKAAFQDLCA